MGKLSKRLPDKGLIFLLFLFLSIIVALGNIFDAITTYFALKLPGNYETNQIMGHIINNFGWFLFFFIKSAFAYLVLTFKYCPMHYFINFAIRTKNTIERTIIIFMLLLVYLLLAYMFLMLSLGNLQHILY